MIIQMEVNTQICTSQKPIGIQDEGMNAYVMHVGIVCQLMGKYNMIVKP
jgi:hypothetical protein